MSKKVIITGVTGQAGSYFVDYLLNTTDHEIYGVVRHISTKNHKNIEHNLNNKSFQLLTADLTDGPSLTKIIEEIKPDYFINAGAMSFVPESWNTAVQTQLINSVSIVHILEAIKRFAPYCRFCNYGSSEQLGDVIYSPQTIDHPFRSRSPYGCSKVSAQQMVKVYRESYNLYALQPMCFNYESKRRGYDFVTRKITKGVARIYHALQKKEDFEPISLGNISSLRDWSHASDIVDGVWRVLNQDIYNEELKSGFLENGWDFLVKNIKEYVLASGITYSIRQFCEESFKNAAISNFEWVEGEKPEDEVLKIQDSKILVKIDPKFYRPADVITLCGDSSPIRKDLGWKPKVDFNMLVEEMVDNDIKELKVNNI